MLYRHRRPLGMPAWSTWVAPGARSGNPPDSHAYGISHDPALLWVYAEWSQWASLRRSAQVGEAVLTLQGKGSRHPFAYPQSHHDRTGRQHQPIRHPTTEPGHREPAPPALDLDGEGFGMGVRSRDRTDLGGGRAPTPHHSAATLRQRHAARPAPTTPSFENPSCHGEPTSSGVGGVP